METGTGAVRKMVLEDSLSSHGVELASIIPDIPIMIRERRHPALRDKAIYICWHTVACMNIRKWAVFLRSALWRQSVRFHDRNSLACNGPDRMILQTDMLAASCLHIWTQTGRRARMRNGLLSLSIARRQGKLGGTT